MTSKINKLYQFILKDFKCITNRHEFEIISYKEKHQLIDNFNICGVTISASDKLGGENKIPATHFCPRCQLAAFSNIYRLLEFDGKY